jgi:hypothetical protein
MVSIPLCIDIYVTATTVLLATDTDTLIYITAVLSVAACILIAYTDRMTYITGILTSTSDIISVF